MNLTLAQLWLSLAISVREAFQVQEFCDINMPKALSSLRPILSLLHLLLPAHRKPWYCYSALYFSSPDNWRSYVDPLCQHSPRLSQVTTLHPHHQIHLCHSFSSFSFCLCFAYYCYHRYIIFLDSTKTKSIKHRSHLNDCYVYHEKRLPLSNPTKHLAYKQYHQTPF